MSPLSPALKTTIEALKKDFIKHNIPTDKPAFYDHANFLKREQIQPDYLENYAAFVELQSYRTDYLKKAEAEIPLICELLHEELLKDGRLGACVDMSIALSRILEAEGYWNYIVKGSLTIQFPPQAKIKDRYFWSYDFNFNYAAAHAWVVAPPFTLLDLTLKQQPFLSGEEKWLPAKVIHREFEKAEVQEIDLISSDLIFDMERRRFGKQKILALHPNYPAFSSIFQANEIDQGNLKLKYIPAKIGAPDEPLERVGTLKLGGNRAIDIYYKIIQPALAELRETK